MSLQLMPKSARAIRALQAAALGMAVLTLAACGTRATKHPAPAKAPGSVGVAADCPWLNPHLPIATRVALIMRKMTIADEIALVEGHGVHPYVGDIPQNAALCLPSVGLEDGPNGVGDGLTGVTQLPSGASLAATFSRRLAYRYGQVIGAEQASKGTSVDLGPTVNIDRDPRWGREFESLSEDPHLAGRLAAAEIRGIQSQGTIAQVKHFDAYNQETNRNTNQDQVMVSQRALHEIYMPAFRTAIRDGRVGSLMCAYSIVNGHYSCQSHRLLTDVLRGEWNFDGFVTTDWLALHSLSGAAAGTDLEEPFSRYFGAPLRKAVSRGAISRAVLNTMVARILYPLFRFGVFDHPRPASTSAVASTPAHRALSTRIAAAGTVLLKNEGHLLPLSSGVKIAVIGPAASAQVSYGGGGSAHVIPSATISPLAGIEALAGRSTVRYAQGLPADSQLTPIPAADLTPPYSGKNPSAVYSAILRPPQTGTYIIGFTNGCHCFGVASVTIDGRTLINDPGTPPTATYSAAVHLNRGHAYRLTVAGPAPMMMGPLPKKLKQKLKKLMGKAEAATRLVWATPATVRADLQEAVNAARAAQVAVVVVADDTETEGADRPNLHLPSAQDALVRAIARANPHTVLVIQAGAPITMPWLDRVPAIVDTWYPGQTDGTALARVLFGRVDPSGHLPVSFPGRLAEVPGAESASFPGVGGKVHYSEGLLVGYRWYDAKHIKPLFPFGFGLSYTRFRYSDLHLSRSRIDGVTPIRVSVRLSNVGSVAGTDVAQLYLSMPATTGEPPRKLVGFRRVTLAPHHSQVVHFVITPREEWWWGHAGWTETAGTYRIYVGDSSALANLPLMARYTMVKSIGDRQVTVSAPKTLHPGARTLVHVLLSAGGNETLHDVHLCLRAPGGWHVEPVGTTVYRVLTPNETAAAQFAVTPPSDTVTQYVTLSAAAELRRGRCLPKAGSQGPSEASLPTQAEGLRCATVRRGGKVVLLGP